MSALTERGLPANTDCERFVLGALLTDRNALVDVGGELTPDDFCLDKHRRILARIRDLDSRGEHVDRITVAQELQRRGELESVDGLTYLASLDDGIPKLPNIDSYIQILREKATLRRTIVECQRLTDRCLAAGDDSREILADAQGVLEKLSERDGKRSQWSNPGQVMNGVPSGINGFLAPAATGGLGLPTPWPSVNAMIGGLQAGELIVVAGRPSMGKSIIGMQLAHHAAVNGQVAAFISLEMSKESLVRRLVCGIGRVDAQRMRSGHLDSSERRNAGRAASEVAELPLWIDENRSNNLHSIRSALRRVPGGKVSLLVVDHLQLMRASGRVENRNRELSDVSHGLKRLAGDEGVAVVLLSQLNRECEKRDGHMPQLSDLAESGSIEQDADIVWFVHRPERYARHDETLRGHAEFIIAKQRNGPIGKLRMVFFDSIQRFDEREFEA